MLDFLASKASRLHQLPHAIQAVLSTSVIGIISTIQNVNWFTTSLNTIDPWFYWGAGNNIPLNYLNGFSLTYYMERYTVILPQIISQSLAGPYFSQLILALFNLFLLNFFIIKIVNILGYSDLAFPIAILTFSNRYLLGTIAISQTQSSSMLWLTMSMYFLLRIKMQDNNRDIGLCGVFLGLAANSYFAHFLVLLPVIFVVIVFREKFSKFIIRIFLLLIGLIISQIPIQIAHKIITNSNEIVIYKHFLIGKSISSHKNPWNGDGFGWFWSNGLFSPQWYFWTGVLIISVILFALSLNTTDSNFRLFIFTSTLINLGVSLLTLRYINIVAFSWVSCILYLTIPACYLTIFNIYKNLSFVYLLTFFIFTLNFFISEHNSFLRNLIYSSIFKEVLLLIVLLGILIVAAYRFNFSKISILLLLSSLMFSIQPNFLMINESGISKDKDAGAIYSELNSNRKLIRQLQHKFSAKILLTPYESLPLQSSMLFGYSLISFEFNKINCETVRNSLQNETYLVLTRDLFSKIPDINENYLSRCFSGPYNWERMTVGESSIYYIKLA